MGALDGVERTPETLRIHERLATTGSAIDRVVCTSARPGTRAGRRTLNPSERVKKEGTSLNTKALKAAEATFLKKYPGGFRHPEMVELGKKHMMEKLETFANEAFSRQAFGNTDAIIDGAVKLVSRSTMVSMFEKPKFRDTMRALSKKDREVFADALRQLLHGKEKVGFDILVRELKKRKLAKWPLATVVQSYFRPNRDVFVKPTTTRLVIEKLELDLTYNATPSWEFYRSYRKSILEIRSMVSETLAPNNPAFCGFLMMTLRDR